MLFDADGIGFGEPYTAPVMAELVRQGVDVSVTDRALGRQLGPVRAIDANGVVAARLPLVFVRVGEEATATPSGAVRLAFHDGDRSPFSLNDVTDRAVAVFLDLDRADPSVGQATP